MKKNPVRDVHSKKKDELEIKHHASPSDKSRSCILKAIWKCMHGNLHFHNPVIIWTMEGIK